MAAFCNFRHMPRPTASRTVSKPNVKLVYAILIEAIIFTFCQASFSSVTVSPLPSEITCDPYDGSFCVCVLSNGKGMYDLRPLVQDGEPPHFKAVKGNQTFFYDPCQPFTIDEIICSGVGVCKEEPLDDSGIFYQNLGFISTVTFKYNQGSGQSIVLNYNNQKQGGKRVESNVVLLCDQTLEKPEFVNYAASTDEYDFTLSSKSSCLAPPPSPAKKRLSFGSVLCIFVSVLAILYFGGGFLYLFFVKKESWSRAVPHYEFWSDLPALIKEGAVYTRDTLTGKTSTATRTTTYDSI